MRADRSVRAWAGCHPRTTSVLVALATFVVAVLGRRGPTDPPLPMPSTVGWVLVVLACAALVGRLRRPVQVWAFVLLACTAATLVDGAIGRTVPALFVGVYTVSAHRPARVAIGALVASMTALAVATGVAGSGELFSNATYAVGAFGGMVCAIGIAVRNQRAVVAEARERARIAELTRDEEAQHRVVEERLRIARELHDVVAHHISVVNVQAGVARHLLRSDVDAADAALATVREAAGLTLREMGSILGLLRTTEDATGTEPAPGVDRVEALVADGRASGLDVEWTVAGTVRPLAPAADLAAYRLVQEALTNARRHGTGAARLALEWTPTGLVVEVLNPLRTNGIAAGGAAGGTGVEPGGHGLVGMRERVAAAGGRLDTGPDGGRFVVRAVLPYDVASGRTS